MTSSSRIPIDEEEENHSSPLRERSRSPPRIYHHHHTPAQIARLEESFHQQPNPDENQRNQLAQELNLSQNQISCWFQDKMTSKKAEMERGENDVLRAENERILKENMLLKKSLENVKWPTCWGLSSIENVERQIHSVLQLKLENAVLKDKIDELQFGLMGSSNDPSQASGPNSEAQSVPLNLFLDSTNQSNPDKNIMFKVQMLNVAKAAQDELIRLLISDEPLWIQSSADNHRMILHSETCERLFPRANPLITSSKVRKESSKSSKVVGIKPMRLVEILMDSDTLTYLFPTIISKARTIDMIWRGSMDNQSGALSMMYQDMHVLSPFVPSREFYFLRYCEKIQEHAWVITDVSFDYSKETTLPACSWRFPSGCLIRAMGNDIGSTEVTWVEHVEVDDNIQANSLYKDVVNTGVAYGAERWLSEIQRMCAKLFTFSPYFFKPYYDTDAVVTLPKRRRNLVKYGDRIMKRFCETLNTSNTGYQQVLTKKNGDGLWICISKNIEQVQPTEGIVLNVAASFLLPMPSQEIFQFFTNDKSHWDIRLGEIVSFKEISRISNDSSSNNSVAILQPLDPHRGLWIIEESISNPWVSYIAYAPLKSSANICMALDSYDPTNLLPVISGITICQAGSTSNIYGESSGSGSGVITEGSLVTLAFEIVTLTPRVSLLDTLVLLVC